MRRPNTLPLMVTLLAFQGGRLPDARAQEAYRLDTAAQQIATETQRQWQLWHFPKGTLSVTTDGVRPRRWRVNTNAFADIVYFLRNNPPNHLSAKAAGEIELIDAVSAGSNREDVVNVLDGNPFTYWEPDSLPEGVDVHSRWWFTVDLGRLIVANRIVLRFVDEEVGDPFLLFDVLISEGFKPTSAREGQSLDFIPVLQMDRPNTRQREFTVDLTGAAKHQRGAAVRFVQIAVRGSRHGRGAEIDADKYEWLRQEAPEDTGTVDYIKKLDGGRELPVPQENYELLPPEERGPVRYFRRERPRLADIEVWQEGEDIARQTLDRGGSVTAVPPLEFSAEPMFDGDVVSTTFAKQRIPAHLNIRSQTNLTIDLGSLFWIGTVQIIQNMKGGLALSTFGNHEYAYSDGSRRVDGSLQWETAGRVKQEFFVTHPGVAFLTGTPLHPTGIHIERQSFVQPVRARFLRVLYKDEEGKFQTSDTSNNFHPFTELQVFGEGFQPQVTIESPLLDPEGTRTLTSIEWNADVPSGTSITLQTRTSQTKSEQTRYYNRVGDEVDSTFYAKNLFKWTEDTAIPDANLKGDIVSTVLLGNDASEWSQPYRHSGARISSPSPRSFVQIRATLVSDTPETAATLKSVRLNYTEPLADRFTGEMTPIRVDSLAVKRPFTLYVQPQFRLGNPGFDGLLLTAPPGMSLGFSKIYSGPATELTGPGNDAAEFQIVNVDVAATADDSLLVSFPAITPASAVELVRLDFTGELFSVGGQLFVHALLSGGSDEDVIWQQIDEGDAARDVQENSLVVVTLPRERRLFTDFDLPAVLTPNGDGVNDTAMLGFSVILVGASRQVEIEIYDLSGHIVRRLSSRREVSAGRYEIEWDGRNDAGTLAPPGLYALRFHVDADDDGAAIDQLAAVRTITVAY